MSENLNPMKVYHYGSPVLKKRTEPVTVFDAALAEFIDRMVDTLYDENGLGLAAPQVGESRSVVVIDLSFGEEVDNILVLVNPEIVSSEGECAMEEGCLSIPGVWEEVTRAERVTVRFRDPAGKEFEIEADGLLARVIQHEVDHLNGVLFVDRLGAVKRTLLARTLREIAEGENGGE